MLHHKATPKHVFLHLLMIIMLTMSVVAVLTILFQYINYLLPDKAMFISQSSIFDGIRWGSSALFITLPVLILCNFFIHKEIKKYKEVKDIKTRRWLLYLTQFVTAITIIIDLITMLYVFYGGELTMRFVLKVLAVLLVAAVVLGYYRWEIKWDGKESKVPKQTAIVIGILALITIIAGFFIVGTPNHQRNVRFDEQRVQDLTELQYDVMNYLDNNNELPSTEEFMRWQGKINTDPETDKPYQYELTSETTFKLCATFATKQEDNEYYKFARPEFRSVAPKGEVIGEDTWEHSAGEHCFEREVHINE